MNVVCSLSDLSLRSGLASQAGSAAQPPRPPSRSVELGPQGEGWHWGLWMLAFSSAPPRPSSGSDEAGGSPVELSVSQGPLPASWVRVGVPSCCPGACPTNTLVSLVVAVLILLIEFQHSWVFLSP